MAKKRTVRESREEIMLVRFSKNEASDTLPRFIGKLRHRLRDPTNKKRDDCARHATILRDPSVKWLFDPGSRDVKGIDVPAKPVKEHFRYNPKTKKKDIRVHRHYRLLRKFPDYCKK